VSAGIGTAAIERGAPAEKRTAAVVELDTLYEQAAQARKPFEEEWFLNLAFYEGNQWVFWNGDRIDMVRVEPHRILLVDNRLIGVVRTEVAKMTKQRPAFTVVPVGGDEDNLDSARLGERVMDFEWKELKLRRKLRTALLWSRICSAGFWRVTWDKNGGDRAVNLLVDAAGKPILDSANRPVRAEDLDESALEQMTGVEARRVAEGDVDVQARSPFQIFPDPLAEALDECEFLIEEVVKSEEYVFAHYGQHVAPDTPATSGIAQSRMSWTNNAAVPGGSSGSYQGVKVRELWRLPCSKYPKGQHVVWAGNGVLYDGPNPYGKLPYVMFPGIDVPGRFWPTTVVEQGRSPQAELNKVKSQVAENGNRFGNPALLESRQARVEYSGRPGERVKFDDTVQNAVPSYLEPPNMPSYVVGRIEDAENAIREISGQHEVSNASVPTGVTAAAAINLLQEQDDTRLGPSVDDMEDALASAGTMILELVARYYSNSRMAVLSGEDGDWDFVDFRGEALRENTTVEVQAGSTFPKSKAARQAAMQEIFNLLIQYQVPLNPRDIRKFFADFEVGGLERLFADIAEDDRQVTRENRRLMRAEQLPINSYDDHAFHIAGHTERQKTAVYERSTPEAMAAMEAHIMLHRQELLNAMPPPTGAPVGGPPANTLTLGNPATGTAPSPPPPGIGPTPPLPSAPSQ
jgi:hypothetical protein